MFGILKKLFNMESDASLAEKIKEGAYLVDVRTPTEFDAGHVKGSVNIPLDRIALSIDKFRNKKSIIVFCRSGNRSSQAATILNQNGIKNVINGGTWQSVRALIS